MRCKPAVRTIKGNPAVSLALTRESRAVQIAVKATEGVKNLEEQP